MTTIHLDNVSTGTAPVVTVSIGEESFAGEVARLYLFPVPDTTGGVSLAGNYDGYIPLSAGGSFTRTLNIDSGTDQPGYVLSAGVYKVVLQNNPDGVIVESEVFTVEEPIIGGLTMTGVDFKNAVGIRITDSNDYEFSDKHGIASAISSIKSAKKAIQDEQLEMTPILNDSDGKINLYSTDGSHDITSADKTKYNTALGNALVVLNTALTSLQVLSLQP